MADKAVQYLPDGAHQAGGGLSGKLAQVRYLSPTILTYLQNIYAQNGSSSSGWTAEQTAVFLKSIQQDDESELALELATPAWDIKNFLKYMTSSVTSLVAPPQEQDLSWPLSAYFISSSHNTYLTGNQLSSDSSADAYKNVLLRGCRCIEVDVWDGEEPDSDNSSVSSSDDEYTVARKQSKRQQIHSLTTQFKNSSLGKKLDHKITSSTTTSKTTSTTTSSPKKHKKRPSHSSSSKKTGSSDSTTGTPLTKTDSGNLNSLQRVPSLKEPRVLHGYTLTKDIPFRDVCMAVRDYGFSEDCDTPLIVSLEVHCSAEQQETMVSIMRQTWGDLLLPEPAEDAKELPAPGDLRGKILVKVKYAPPQGGGSPPAAASRASTPIPGSDASNTAAAAAAQKPSKIIQALSKLGIYTRGVSFKSLAQPEATMPTHIFSLSENSVTEVHQKSARELFEHNRHYLMRAYPSGLRIRSSNLDPAVFWRKGIQVVALNWQNWDEGMMLNEGMFAGTKGYVLKPEGYRPNKTLPSTKTQEPQSLAVKHYTMDLTIQVIAAQNLPLPPGDTKTSSFRPYVKVEIHVEEPGERHGTDAVPADGKEKEGEYKAKTKSVKGGGCDPDWKGEGNLLKFEKIPGVVPELSFVRFLIKDDEIGKDSLAAWACVRLDRLREGYRFLHVCDARGVETEGVILVKVTKKLVREV
ncbi:PLC-like phosphodiesterase [Podospora fimiseda]|uniref:Phosphoinositide phospholipase C n=1 Tax=Podospora fimiseda TaxID=252190 RepID=A0AAN7BGM4_9PEZI|nr:PLC-like phosphodiesterase [Podospora fimiseda]